MLVFRGSRKLMIRTQVYLTEPLYKSINQLADKENKPAARVVRELLEAGLEKKKAVSAKEAFMEIVRIGKKAGLRGPTDLSVSIDKILYED